jgi:hypothetical protein
MGPRLKEDPREWRKFMLVLTVVVGAGAAILGHRQVLPWAAALTVGAAAVLVLAIAWVRPRWFRPLYRGAMTGSHYLGQGIGRILLALFFLVVLTPLGWLLRGLGKDLLGLKRPPHATTYWQPARLTDHFDREF